MKFFLAAIFTAIMVAGPAPARAGSWTDSVMEWFTELFSSGEDVPPPATDLSPYLFDSLFTSPTGLLLNTVADADTLAISSEWPYVSLDPAADLERHNRLLRQTILLTPPASKLPLRSPAVRIVYRYDQRPAGFIRMARRFANVQEIPFEEVIGYALPVGLALPTIIISDDPPGQSPFNQNWFEPLYELSQQDVTLIHFGDVARITGIPKAWSAINSPLRCKESEAFLAQAIFGAELLDGRLETTTPAFARGTGFRLEPVRTGFRLPELLGIDRTKLDYVDHHINRGIRYRAMPGAQLLVMKDGQVVFERAYGHQTYRKQEVTPGDLYDLASITKAAATTLAVMKLYDQGKIKLDARVRDYLPDLKRNLIGRYKIERLLAHHTGLQSEIPLTGLLGKKYVADSIRGAFTLPIGPERWLDEEVPARVRKNLSGKIGYTRRQVYKYSDLNYYVLQQVVEAIASEPMEALLEREFYALLRLGKLGFRPAGKFPSERLVPTVSDQWMRGGLLRGYVHDEGAALMGGVGGHAGLFANAHDLGQLFQLLIDEGVHEGKEILSPETVRRFTAKNRYNHRALGFDRLAGGFKHVVGEGASRKTFGHLGFSGTSVWADPENKLVYVLLTNRVHPDPKNDRFMSMQIRGRVYQGIYRALDTWASPL